jgi:hypothetical protein
VTVPPADELAQAIAERPTRFTTLEDEEARLRAQLRRPWIGIAAQLGALVGMLAGFAALAFYFSRPPSADALYESISARVDSDDEAYLSDVANDVDEFLQRYPNDARAGELQQHQHQLELDKLERKLHRQARNSGASDPTLLPVEQLYLQATSIAERSPEDAVAMLNSLVELYGAATADDSAVSAVVQLASRRSAALTAQIAEQRRRQLASLHERLDTAGRLAESDPQQAAAMYRAMIELHSDDEWAVKVVGAARNRLAELGATGE